MSFGKNIENSEFRVKNLWQQLDPRIKLLSILLLIIFIIFTPSTDYIKFIVFFLIILIMIFISKLNLKNYILRSLFLIPLLGFIILSIIFFSDLNKTDKIITIHNMFTKTVLTYFSISILATSINFNEFLKALRLLKLPNLIIYILSFSYHYMFLFYKEIKSFLKARDSRSYGKKNIIFNIKLVLKIIPTFFSRVLEKSGKIYAAMLSRGYSTSAPIIIFHRITRKDILFFSFFIIVLLAVIICL